MDEHGTDPTDEDTDDDGLQDGEEVDEHGTDPLDEDTDDDGLQDGEEVDDYGTDPTDEDTDDGGVDDGTEVDRGSDPLDPSDDFPGDTGLSGAYKGGWGSCNCASVHGGAGAAGAWAIALLAGLLFARRRED